MSRKLHDLHPEFRPLANELLAKLIEAKLYVLIFSTGRSEREHLDNLASGRSKIKGRSYHQDGLAIDNVIVDSYQREGGMTLQWKRKNVPQYEQYGEIVKGIGLTWGGDWWDPTDPDSLNDPYHAEHPDAKTLSAIAQMEEEQHGR